MEMIRSLNSTHTGEVDKACLELGIAIRFERIDGQDDLCDDGIGDIRIGRSRPRRRRRGSDLLPRRGDDRGALHQPYRPVRPGHVQHAPDPPLPVVPAAAPPTAPVGTIAVVVPRRHLSLPPPPSPFPPLNRAGTESVVNTDYLPCN